MKTKSIITSIAMAFLMLFSINTNAQDFPKMDKSPMDAAAFPTSYKDANKLIKIVYSRPQLNGRSLEKLAPNGDVWRTGANEAAELTLYTTMALGDTKIPPGTYTFYVIPGDKEWTAIVSKDINVWGSYFYKQENDVARLKVPVSQAKESLEAFGIYFEESKDGVHMNLGWGTARVAVPFSK
ncbi:DUF2911 domain-containing protein [Psychroserpens sp. SPM9]|uniref:DUF2911 domain-containing protein n=1 Tax=Psychroserpens sp. SPM9 TaxID=2975598 RepID=UPI0021A3F630|nr:DUF2911 domain-containing protein [Psychroserpens sp. SPM9]MDG5493092.1 DUF2911 domain-containing protein [Psychroserpens sp. SPM9]